MTNGPATKVRCEIRVLADSELDVVNGGKIVIVDCLGTPPPLQPGDVYWNPWLPVPMTQLSP